MIVDSGNFDWAKSKKFPGFIEPDASYSNMIYAADWGTLAFIVKVLIYASLFSLFEQVEQVDQQQQQQQGSCSTSEGLRLMYQSI